MTARGRTLVQGVALLALGLAAGRFVLSAFVRSALYPAPLFGVPSPPPPPLEELPLALDGQPLSAWWLPPRAESTAVVLVLHGNGENLGTLAWSGLFERFAELGAGVVALDYPGYGRSAGRPSEHAIVAAARVAWGEVVARAGEERPRVAAGWSLGAAAAAQLAAAEPETVDALLLLSAWTRLAEVAALHFPGWLVGPLLQDRYDTLGAAPAIRCPALVAHGARDDLIPVAQGRAVHDALAGPKRWLEVAGAGHNDLLAREETWRALAEALESAARR
jgi:hypothetical protein